MRTPNLLEVFRDIFILAIMVLDRDHETGLTGNVFNSAGFINAFFAIIHLAHERLPLYWNNGLPFVMT
jgi:hypothetical protein